MRRNCGVRRANFQEWWNPKYSNPGHWLRRSQNTRSRGGVKILIVADGVPDGGAHAEYVVGAEAPGADVVVIVDVVVVNLGTHEEMVPHVITKAGPEILHKVVVAGVVNALAGEAAARCGKRNVEAGSGDSDSSEQVEADFLAELGLIERIEIGQDGPVAFIAEITGLAGSPRGFNHNSNVAFEADDVSGDSEVSSTFFGELAGKHRTGAGRG